MIENMVNLERTHETLEEPGENAADTGEHGKPGENSVDT